MGPSFDIRDDNGGAVRAAVTGRLDVDGVVEIWPRAREALRRRGDAEVVLEASGVSYCDGAGAAMLVDLETEHVSRGGRLRIEALPEEYRPLLELLRTGGENAPPPRIPSPPLAQLGEAAERIGRDLLQLVNDVGRVAVALGGTVLHPHRVRWRDVLAAAEAAGVNAFPVVVLLSSLLGLILAYQTAATFARYGADVFLADMLAISLVRELGPLMTAITLTARSGSAFAAEIGTMKVNEEVDALDTMGLEPTAFLVTPRVLAAVFMTPLLAVFASLAGLVGGLFVWMATLGLPPRLYVRRVLEAVDVTDFTGGLVKAFAFGAVVAAIGCIRGLQTRGGASAVGRSATRAVVSGIIGIALVDMVFAIVFFYLGI